MTLPRKFSLPVFPDPNFQPLFGRRVYNNPPGDDPTVPLTPPEPPAPPADDPLKAPGLKALEAERATNKLLKDQIKALEDKFAGIDPDAVADLKKTAEQREQEELEAKSQYALALKLKEEKHLAELQGAKAEVAKYQQRIERNTIEQTVLDAFLGNGGHRGDGKAIGPKSFVKLLMPAIVDRLAIVEGEVVVVDDKGEIAWNKETFKPVSIDDLMLECRTTGATASLFEPIDKAAGAGAHSNSRRSAQAAHEELSKLSGAARLRRARQLGIA